MAKLLARGFLALLCALALPSTALADDSAAAKRHYVSGSRHFDVGEYAEALADFKEAYKLKDDPVFLYNIAQCHRLLHQPDDAIRSYQAYLRRAPDSRNRVEIERRIVELEEASRPAPPSTPPPAAPMPVVTEPPVAPVTVVASPKRTPLYKKWWLWTTVGAVVLVGVGVGVGVGIVESRSTGTTFPAVAF